MNFGGKLRYIPEYNFIVAYLLVHCIFSLWLYIFLIHGEHISFGKVGGEVRNLGKFEK